MDYLKIISAILIWSSLGIFVRKIDVPNHGIIFYTAAIAAGFQFAILSFSGRFRTSFIPETESRRLLLVFLVPLCFLANTLFFYFAFTHTTIAKSVLTHYTAPIFVALLAPVLLKERIHKTTWLAIVISTTGLWLILGTPDLGEFTDVSMESRGILAGTLSGLAYAFLMMVIRAVAAHFSSLYIIFIQNTGVSLLLLPFILDVPLTFRSIPYLVILGVVHSTIAPLLYVRGFRTVKANEAAILGYLEPTGAILLALLFLNEVPGLTSLSGGLLILYSGYMILKRRGM